MKKLSVSALVAAVALAYSTAGSTETLKEIVTFAVETHPQVLSAMHKKDAADSATDAAFGGYLPRIDMVIGGGRERSQNTTTLGLNPPPNNPTNRKDVSAPGARWPSPSSACVATSWPSTILSASMSGRRSTLGP